jgi:hypothetical protein
MSLLVLHVFLTLVYPLRRKTTAKIHPDPHVPGKKALFSQRLTKPLYNKIYDIHHVSNQYYYSFQRSRPRKHLAVTRTIRQLTEKLNRWLLLE